MTPLLEVDSLEMAFSTGAGDIKCLDRVSLHVNPGEILCIVGESGSGKSVTLLSVMGLLGENGKITGGKVVFDGQELLHLPDEELDRIRGSKMTMIFQDAMASLNPLFTIGNQIMEAMRIHMNLDRKTAKERALLLLDKVGLPDPSSIMNKYPHTLSGGMRQRAMIAMALACDPKLLIADEPTTALDVTIQAQIMELLRNLREELHMSIILITHDMGLVAEMADRVMVMYAGQIVEEAGVLDLFKKPGHPYTQALLKSIPSIRDKEERELLTIKGTVPEHYGEITGCRFANRCPYMADGCDLEQSLVEIEDSHGVRCWRAEEIREKKTQASGRN